MKPDRWYRCSRSGPGLCYWDGPQSELAGVDCDRCPVCLAPAVEVSKQQQQAQRHARRYQTESV